MYYPIKRLLDLLFSLVLLVIFAPIFVFIGLLILIDSQGSIFFTQRRYGREGTYFNIYKFRTMRVGTPNLATDQIDNPQDYITRIGWFLRKSSLDELPQLMNILLGQMSFVGPRPALYNQYQLIEVRKASRIDNIKPGLTGYAQVMGRDSISNDQKVVFDKYYLDHISFFLDFKIVYLTVFKVIKAEDIRE